MTKFCPITGETPCKCNEQIAHNQVGTALLLDYRVLLRKLFSDHVIYTLWLINSNDEELEFVTERLLRNPIDFRNVLKDVIGDEKASIFEEALTAHLVLAAKLLESVKTNDENIKQLQDDFYKNGDEIGVFLSSLNPTKLSSEYGKQLFEIHNTQVIKLAILRHVEKNYKVEVEENDKYFKHAMIMADVVYELFTL